MTRVPYLLSRSSRQHPAWAVFISGQGSNMSALLDSEWGENVRLVVSSRSNAYGALRARRRGVAVEVLPTTVDGRRAQSHRGITHIFLAGFMKIIPFEFLKAWNKPILNVHPSLLPAYPGLRSLRRAHEDGADVGITVHRVVADVDAGPVVAQRLVCQAETTRALPLEQIERLAHATEYSLVRRAYEVASCWT